MSIEIKEQDEISLNELVDLQESGFSVLRSAHVGNARTYNQVLAAAGISMLLVDHNVTAVDKNYMPGCRVTDGVPETLTAAGQLVSRCEIDDESGFSYLDQIHVDSLRTAFPAADIFTNTEYLRAYESVTAEIINICSALQPGLFKRKVYKGDTETTKMRYQPEITAAEVLQLQDDPRVDEGLLLPNEIDIVINFVLEALRTGQDVQYHISGPAMVKYIKQIMPTIEELGTAVLSNATFASRLPEVLRVELVPGTPLRFAGTQNSKAVLEDFADAVTQANEAGVIRAQKKKQFFASSSSKDAPAREEFLQQVRADERAYQQALNAAADACVGFFDTGQDIPSVTQYDVLRSGGLFVPEISKEMTMKELELLYKALCKNRGTP